MEILKSEILDFIEQPISFLRIKYGSDFHKIYDENGFSLLHHLIYHIMTEVQKDRRHFYTYCHHLFQYQFDYHCFSKQYTTEQLGQNKIDKIVKYPSVISPIYFFLPAFKDPALLADLHNSGLLNSLIPQFKSIYDKQGINIFFTAIFLNELDYIRWALRQGVPLLNEILHLKRQDLYDCIHVTYLGDTTNVNAFYTVDYQHEIIEALKKETQWESIIEKQKLEHAIHEPTNKTKIQKI